MGNLTRTRSVMQRLAPPGEIADFAQVTFVATDDENPENARSVAFPVSVWEDMGSPDVVTLTVEPGDLLNG